MKNKLHDILNIGLPIIFICGCAIARRYVLKSAKEYILESIEGYIQSDECKNEIKSRVDELLGDLVFD